MAVSCLALGLLLSAAPGDVYFEQTVVTSTDGRASGPGVVSQVWYSGRKMRMEAGDELRGPAFILRLDLGKAYRLDPLEKTALEIDAARLRARSQMDLSMAGDLMGSDEEGSARTQPLKARRTIAGFVCRGFRISAGSTVMDVYVTDAIPIGIERPWYAQRRASEPASYPHLDSRNRDKNLPRRPCDRATGKERSAPR